MENKEVCILLAHWKAAFKTATDFDMWGQPVEAVETYKRLSNELHQHANSTNSVFSESQRKNLEKIVICIESRERLLQSEKPGQATGMSLNDIRRLESMLSNILCTSKTDFPLDISMAHMQLKQHMGKSQSLFREKHESHMEDKQGQHSNGNLLPRPLAIPGMTLLTVQVEQIGLKDVSQYIDPFLTVSVKGFGVFFELKHYKPPKKAISTRCWSFLEKDEIKEGPIALELYKKPTDFLRRNISLFTVKPLYLHLRLKLFR